MRMRDKDKPKFPTPDEATKMIPIIRKAMEGMGANKLTIVAHPMTGVTAFGDFPDEKGNDLQSELFGSGIVAVRTGEGTWCFAVMR